MTSFKLQSVLDYRKLQKDKAQQLLAEAIRKEASLVAQLAALREEIRVLHRDMKEDQAHGVTAHELELYENRCTHKTECIVRIERTIEAARGEIIARRQALLSASQDKKALEKLKERKLEEAEKEMKKKENATIDEIALRFHGSGDKR